MARCIVHTFLFLLLNLLICVQSVEEKYHQNILDRSEEIIRAQDAEESLYKKDLTKITDTLRCEDPLHPTNGFIDGTDFSIGSTVHVRCNTGYYLVGTAVMSCLAVPNPFKKKVMWDPTEPRECKPRQHNDDVNELSYKFVPEQAVALDDYEPKYGQFGAIPFPDTKVSTGLEGVNEPCTLPKIVGTCRAAFIRYYFDTESMECHKFIYGGCDGNENNFKTVEECIQNCPAKKPPR